MWLFLLYFNAISWKFILHLLHMSNKVGLSLGLFPFTKTFYRLKEVVCLWKQQYHYYCIYLASGSTGS